MSTASKPDSSANFMVLSSGLPEFDAKSFLHGKFLFTSFLQRIDNSHRALETDMPELVSEENFSENSRTAHSAASKKKLAQKNKAKRAHWIKRNNVALSFLVTACTGEKNRTAMQIVKNYRLKLAGTERIPKAREILELLEERFFYKK